MLTRSLKPPPSPARVAANRANSQRSSGPRTAEGKPRSRANAVKHGLTGAGVAPPTEDAAAIEERFLVIQEELAPATVLGAELAHELALLSVRRWRCARAETALLHGRTRHAAAEFDRARAEQADRLVEAIEAQPRASRRALLAMPEGVDRLAAELAMLREELVGPAPAWTQGHHQRLDALFGFRLGDLPWSRPTRFFKAVLGDFAAIGVAEVAHLADPDERWTWAAVPLIGAIDAEITRVRAHGARLDRRAMPRTGSPSPMPSSAMSPAMPSWPAATARPPGATLPGPCATSPAPSRSSPPTPSPRSTRLRKSPPPMGVGWAGTPRPNSPSPQPSTVPQRRLEPPPRSQPQSRPRRRWGMTPTSRRSRRPIRHRPTTHCPNPPPRSRSNSRPGRLNASR